MKNLLVIMFSVLISINAYSQKGNYNVLALKSNVIKVSDNDFKYYRFNEKKNVVEIYNLDNTISETISLNIPENAFLDEILDVSTNRLNSDSDIEVIYRTYSETYSDVFENTESIVYEHYNLMAVDVKGEELFNFDTDRSFSIDNNNMKIFEDLSSNEKKCKTKKECAGSEK